MKDSSSTNYTPSRSTVLAVAILGAAGTALVSALTLNISGHSAVLGWLLVCGSVAALGLGIKVVAGGSSNTAAGRNNAYNPHVRAHVVGRSHTLWSRLGRMFAHRY